MLARYGGHTLSDLREGELLKAMLQYTPLLQEEEPEFLQNQTEIKLNPILYGKPRTTPV